jgi:hypothetical protein
MAQIIICAGISVVPYIRPVGPFQLANVLRKQGYTVQVIDQYPWIAHLGADTVIKLFDKFVGPETLWIGFSSTWFRKISTLLPGPDDHLPGGVLKNTEDLVANTMLFPEEELIRIKQSVLNKNPKVKFVLGGGRSTLGRSGRCRPLIDYSIEGYADDAVVKFSKWLEGKAPKPFMHLNYGGKSESMNDDIKASNFDYTNFEFRWADEDLVNPGETLPMEIARGCIFNCAFCSYPLNGRKKMDYLKNPEVLRKQFIDNYERFGTTNYFFLDDTFNDSVEKLQILHDEVFAKLPFKVSFGAFMRLDLINAHRETIPLLRDMGITGAFLGVESLTYESNKSIGKGISGEKIIEILTILKQEWPNAILDGQFIMGLPYDSEESIRAWLDLLLTEDFPLDAANIAPLNLDQIKANISPWVSHIEMNPEKFGYTFEEGNSFAWTNNVNFSLKDAIRVKQEYGRRWKVKEKPAWVGDYGLMNIGVSPDVIAARRLQVSDQEVNSIENRWSTNDFDTRINFVKLYVNKLLNL